MATAPCVPPPVAPDRAIELSTIDWEQYRAINDALIDRSNPRMIYHDGSLTLLNPGRGHYWIAEKLGLLAATLAGALGLDWESGGSSTYRCPDRGVGIEGDKTYYFGKHAAIM